ncbi:hypothetical protein [Anabaena subtropica]|uniref:Uncharacterized protein n=1 Tax=Anabaena subtropica FACHB-260 TaxID=2692884 RepID=A0ABR8CJH9_9NOST|nr:hypothetical protein [Anabaena subtropica]MBD2342688.1 hypothetical protein [Anabaena subtropica FACHB-260]
MFYEVINQSKITANSNINSVTSTESQQKTTQPSSIDISDIAISLTPVGLVFSWVIFFIILRKIRSIIENKMVFTVNGLHQLPCKNCQFYANNHYLKCAVQPSVVLTEEAKNCSEYSPKKDKFDSNQIL